MNNQIKSGSSGTKNPSGYFVLCTFRPLRERET